ncbi:MAG: hypothetical protein GQ538_05540 [Xanthomonadales bacterium]|nr:hypothetical protein [Xanthomonadales bacterium]
MKFTASRPPISAVGRLQLYAVIEVEVPITARKQSLIICEFQFSELPLPPHNGRSDAADFSYLLGRNVPLWDNYFPKSREIKSPHEAGLISSGI